MITEIRFRDFRQQYPRFLPAVLVILGALVAVDFLLVDRLKNYDQQISTIRGGMSDIQRQRGTAVQDTRQEQQRLMLEIVRRQAIGATALHLSLDVDSGTMRLMQEGAVLREFRVVVGPERRLSPLRTGETTSIRRGADSVVRVLSAADAWPVPKWVYSDRRLPAPADSMVPGALGPVAVVLASGTVVYSLPSTGPLRDKSYLLPGAARADEGDLRAVAPNLAPGTPVYIY
jgi:hypothetical protein